MARIYPGEFLRQVRSETAKIVWPTRKETMMTAMMVVIMTSLLAIFFFGVDLAFSAIVKFAARPAELRGITRTNVPLVHHPRLFGLREQGSRRDHGRGQAPRPRPLVEAVEVPTEKVTEVRRGKKVTVGRANSSPATCSPSWQMNDDVYHLVKNTPKVTGFLGANGKPQPISDAEAARILNTKEEAAAAAPKHKISVDYEIGDKVKVLDGPFASFNGIVEELDFDRSRVKVSVSIFGRATPVELEFEQVERVK